MPALKKLVALAASAALTACATPNAGHDGLYAVPTGDAPVTANPTAYTPALMCLAALSHDAPAPRIAVGRILDYTGAISQDGGREITQGASLMAISAFAKAGARLVERFDTSVTELELRYANSRLLNDGAGSGVYASSNVRHITAGQMPGSDYYFVGGVTELNYDIRSSAADAEIGATNRHRTTGSVGGRVYVMNIAMDFRLIDTRTLEVVDVISYQKQIVGHEVRAGVFNFFGDTFVDIAAGQRSLEPVQLAVRAGVERAVVEVMSNLYHVPDSSACAQAMARQGDPMGPAVTAQSTGAFQTGASGPALAASVAQRSDTNAWNASRDANFSAGLRGTSEQESPTPGPQNIGPSVGGRS
ncbi:MAG TPA: holdfast anchoring protein HfaB [Caulobacterales bacterium]|nr:holdfast anchoring protein HfaB [Caulobacterales bacterium]